MLDKSLYNPTEQFLQTFQKLGNYGRRPQGIAVLGSIALHGLAALTIPFWATSDPTEESTEVQAVVPVMELSPEVQNRLPTMAPPLDLSIFETNPGFDLNMSALNGQAIAPDPNSLSLLPTPMSPNFGQSNFSFVPISPPPIASSYSGFTPPPPPRNMSFLPPPPPLEAVRPSESLPSLSIPGEVNGAPPASTESNGSQQQLTITPRSNNADLIQRQRQLEAEAAIATRPRNNAPENGNDVRFDAELLRSQELRGDSDTAPTPPQMARNSATVSRTLSGNYPRNACSSQASGTATYTVVVNSNGAPSQVNLAQSSGSNVLDGQAAQDIRNARFDGNNINYRVSVNYRYEPAFCAAFSPPPASPANPPAPPAPPAIEPANPDASED
ncbi:TonB family protein [Picosynechococcus sp. NKBG15041c]|uniref:TonB family protein n=1 Tax=Picosynechococcus sp. NKBG15041c TaxID=1407650 RepID=UPI0003F8ACF3|nr:TonB family protein [Picosynechococcus sp. NKBG15041c]